MSENNYISCQLENGSVNISEDVVNSMVKTAIAEVDGVSGLSNTAGSELAELFGLKTVSRGIKVQFVDTEIVVDLIITVKYGYKIVDVAKSVQEKVMTAVQATTGVDKAVVNVHVSGIAFDK